MKVNSNDYPEIIQQIGDGTYLYHFDIEEVSVDGTNSEPHKGYEYNEVKIIGLLTANSITESVMNSLWGKDIEQKLINDFYASQMGILDTSYEDKYKSFLTDRKRIKEQINLDFNKYNKEVL